jgi:hypothetical protein
MMTPNEGRDRWLLRSANSKPTEEWMARIHDGEIFVRKWVDGVTCNPKTESPRFAVRAIKENCYCASRRLYAKVLGHY